MPHLHDYASPPVPRPTRALYTSTAPATIDLRRVPKKPILCDCGSKAGSLPRALWYYCPSCEVVIRVFPGVGRVETSRARYQSENPGVLEQLDPKDSAGLEVEDPGIY